MAEGKKSFLLYSDVLHTVDKMPNEKAGELFKHILNYVNDKNPQTDDLIIQLAFEPIKQSLKRDLQKYENIKEKKRLAGLASGEARKKKNKNEQNEHMLTDVHSVEQNGTKRTVSVSDSVSVSNKLDDYVVNPHLNFSKECLESESWKESISMRTKVPIDKIQFAMAEFLQHLVSIGEEHKRLKDFKYHFSSWVIKVKNKSA